MARRWFSLAGLAFLLSFTPTITSAEDPPSALQDAATRAKLAKDALQAGVDTALSNAGKLDADAAIIILQSAENDVQAASFLTPEEKKALLSKIEARRKTLSKPA
ncbi:MAG TPA: hypothetical protein PKA06_13550, partial [Gemmatales bacterium]|nr:hypothetical protein [Gemmatales bacterium]